jgi:diacylglycerol O-acyltransferase/trehalose O-mycolyltransferase
MSRARRLASIPVFALIVAFLPAAPADALVVEGAQRLEPRLLEFTLSTPALTEPTHVRVLLPDDYRRDKRRYAVLYLLHGANGYYGSWTKTALNLTKRLPLIVVTPDGGPYGFYSDWWNDGRGGPPMWESYHTGELIPWIDSRFRTKAVGRARAVAGYSMGGFGALSYAARHPGLFSVAASFSGPVDSDYRPLRSLFETQRTPLGNPAVWGPPETQEARWQAHNPLDLAPLLGYTRVLLFTGNGQPGGAYGGGPDPFEADIEQTNLSLDRRLEELGIPHLFVDRPGTHAAVYAKHDLAETLDYLIGVLPHSANGNLRARMRGAIRGNRQGR